MESPLKNQLIAITTGLYAQLALSMQFIVERRTGRNQLNKL